MSDTKAQPEPTMEEILASIRRIISENDDQTGGAAGTAAGAPAGAGSAPQAAAAPAESVLDLTEMVAEDGSVVSLTAPFDEDNGHDNLVSPEDKAVSDDDDDDSVIAVDEDDDEIPPVPGETADDDDDAAIDAEEEAEEPEVTMADAQNGKVEFSAEELIGKPATEGLLAAATAAATTAAFASLSRASQQTTGGEMALGSGRTLEELVQEMMRPMIKEWLDKNLPAMTERLVRKELERLSRRAED